MLSRWAWRALCTLLLRLIPASRHAVVHGWPDDEGNAVEVIRALRRRYRGKVYWLLSDTQYAGPAFAAAELADRDRVVRVPKDSARAVLLALTAEATFFTHGLFTAVAPPMSRLVVNLWHGDGPKLAAGTASIRSTVAVAGTRLWGKQRQQRFGLPDAAVAIVGNPRVDQFRVTPTADVLERLGLDPKKRMLLWLPTYRAASGPHGRAWEDSAKLSSSSEFAQIANALVTAAAGNSVQLVLKPHPLDADSLQGLGVPILHHAQLSAAGVTLYQLLGAADALVSDVSSVWVDYLALDRPIGFYAPDLEDLNRQGKLNIDDPDALLPGTRLRTAGDAVRFVHDIAHKQDELRPSRFPGAQKIGPISEGGIADRLLDWLNEFQRKRRREVLFAPAEPKACERALGGELVLS